MRQLSKHIKRFTRKTLGLVFLLYFFQWVWEKCRRYIPVPPDQTRKDIAYFMPGEAVLLAEHGPGLSAVEILARTQAAIERLSAGAPEGSVRRALDRLIAALERLRWLEDVRRQEREPNSLLEPGALAQAGQPDPVLIFEPETRRPFSLVFVKQLDGIGNTDLIGMFDYLNRRIIGGRDGEDGLALRVVSPNWLTSGAQPGVTGGPGARPAPAAPLLTQTGGNGTQEVPYKFHLPERMLDRAQAQTDVDVVILDTAPARRALAGAYARWQASHPLIGSLLAPGTLNIIPNPNLSPKLSEHVHIDGHDYIMSDHGLFVAGIIHSIAPKAQLHLVEILNAYGVGSIETLLRVFELLIRMPKTRPLVINCSLMVTMPYPGHCHPGLDWRMLQTDCELIERMGWLLEWLCDILQAQGALIVAAAGNDGNGGDRPPPRSPARFESVLGVGALTRDNIPANYSNLADNPTPVGVVTFGGRAINGAAQPQESVLGVYIGDFPDTLPGATIANANGWGWWAGTSFAAPVLSGSLALLLARGTDPATALAQVQGAAGHTSEGEVIFPVQQGT